jgi:selenocysteine-specific elongation factor
LRHAETRLVLGTAGHIDHGKTALVRALTGVDTDRLPEEKARGITIELGFAALELDGGLRLGVVDVPGHEALVRTMVAGACGIDLVLLVVAADEGVMPQTREHLAICELLGVTRGVVALSKVDAAGPELAELAEAELSEQLASTTLAGAPVVRVSTVTGAGLDALRDALRGVAEACAGRTPRSGPARLAIDRRFAARGFGAVVTGTLLGAPLRVGDPVELQPSGRAGRVRGLQQHGVAAEVVEPGSRCAVNLQGIELEQLSRGQVLATPGALAPTLTLDLELRWLDVAPAADAPVSVELLTGTAERRARLAPLGDEGRRPGRGGFARLHLDGEPLPALPGDRCVVRGFARTEMGGTTLGGGTILDVAPPRRRRSDPELLRDLEELAKRVPERDLHVRLRRAGLAGATRDRLGRETGLDPRTLDQALEALRGAGQVTPVGGDLWLDEPALQDVEQRLLAALEAFHRREPLQPGMPGAALRGTLPANVARETAETALARRVTAGDVRLEAEVVALARHRPTLAPAQARQAERILSAARQAGLEAPSLRDWSASLGLAAPELRDLLAHLEREGRLVRAGGELWFDRDCIDELRERVTAHLLRNGRLDTPDYKALIGTTRRTAVPLMELFDEERLTLRRGDTRLLHPSRRPGGDA